jgi:hypothetical protein
MDGSDVLRLDTLRAMLPLQNMTAGTMTMANPSVINKVIHKFSWTNAMITALGAVLSGDIAVCTLPAKTVVTNAYIVVGTAAGGPTTLTMSIGRTGATYLDYINNSDIKAAANTVYGDAVGERGTNLTGYDLAAFAATTTVYAHIVGTVTNLNTVTTSTGSIYLETMILP